MVELSKHKKIILIHTILRINKTTFIQIQKTGPAGEKTMEVFYHGKFRQNK